MYLKREKRTICSIDTVQIKDNKIYHNNKYYTIREWYVATSNFRKLSSGEIILMNSSIMLPKIYLWKMYKLNVLKHSILGLILPSVVFLLISSIVSWVLLQPQDSAIVEVLEINETSLIFLKFLMVMFLLMGLGLLYKYFIKKSKIVYSKRRSNEGYVHMSYERYRENLDNLKHQYIYFKPIETKRLIIREIDVEDTSDYYYFSSSEEVHKHLSGNAISTIEETKSNISNIRNQYINKLIHKLAIHSKMDNKLIGYIGLSTYDLTISSCQIVYAIHQDFWGKGYVSEALKVFIEYLIKNGKTLIIAGHVEENLNSGKVLIRNGFIRDEKRDNVMIIHGEPKNIISYVYKERI